MIGKIKGIIDSVEDDSAIIDVCGVGYILYCTSGTLIKLEVGSTATFFTHMVVKEDQLTLYGFATAEDKRWFNILQSVQGVGPRMALAILGTISITDIYNSIISQDDKSFKTVSGVGPKLASRIVNELKGKKNLFSGMAAPINISNTAIIESDDLSDVISALTNLGFSRKDVFPVASEIKAQNENISLEDTIKQTLAQLTSK
jgi:Holliday junction DNA helicase RuvA